MTEIGIERLRARDRQEDETENGEPDKTVAHEEADAIPGIDGDEHVGIRNHVDEAANRDYGKPDDHNRPEQGSHCRRPARLSGKQANQNHGRER